jgi:Domain of unknown function (DUF4270)
MPINFLMNNSPAQNNDSGLRKMNSFYANFFIGLFIVALTASCKKDPSSIGLDLLDEGQMEAIYTEDLEFRVHTIKFDSVKTSLPASLVCGHFYDDYFGVTNASFYTEVLPASYNPNFGTNPVADSCVLSLVFNGSYGVNEPINFKLYKLTERLYKDSTYYSNQTKTHDPTPLADITLTPNTTDSVSVSGKNQAPQLRITLPNSFASLLLTNSSAHSDATTFLNFLNGFCLKATLVSSNQSVYYFNTGSANTKLTVYYTNTTPGQSFTYNLGGSTARFNNFAHDYSAAPDITSQLSSPDTVSENYIYIKGLVGLKGKITFENIQEYFSGSTVFINKAELIMQTDPGSLSSYYATPENIILLAIDSDGVETNIPDQLTNAAQYSYGGTYDNTNKRYTFNIARYLQQVLSGEIIDRGLHIVPVGGAVLANRVVLGGSINGSNKMQLKITYTKL